MKKLTLVGVLFVSVVMSMSALPRFASRLNFTCSNCHVNPTGGGMRNFFGATTFGREDLPIPSWQDEYFLDGFTTQLNQFIAIGADFRMLYFYQETGLTTARNSFFQMQSDLYLNAKLAKNVSIYLNRGNGGRVEAFGLADVLPFKGYVKAGWFVPNFGIRTDDHNILTREKTLFAFGGGHDAGIEFGFSPGIFNLTASVTNGTTADRDNNSFKALLGRGEIRLNVAGFNLRAGGSYYNNAHTSGVLTLFGAHGMISVGDNLTILGEYVQRRDYSNATLVKTYSNIMYVEADYRVMQGIDLKAGYEFYDPDTKYKTGTESRLLFGLEFFPLSGVELRPTYVIRTEEPTDSMNNQFLMMIHFYL